MPLVLTGDQEFTDGWVFFYDSEAHQTTHATADMIAGNSPILVDRNDGTARFTGTAFSVEHYIDEYTEQQRRRREGWPDALDDRLRDLLALVRDGHGKRDARVLDIYVSQRHVPGSHTVRDELIELEKRGLVRRRSDSEGGVGNRWEITSSGLRSIDDTG
ncbi:MAG: hypothetical protein JWO37_3697 [Acidimicrobiales bacterium]|nr:hypothetical protein [Acidimicrobiales bacterium]